MTFKTLGNIYTNIPNGVLRAYTGTKLINRNAGYGYVRTDDKGYVPIDGPQPHWNPGNPNLSWGDEGFSGIDNKRYLYYPKMDFYTNEDGTIKAFGGNYPIVRKRGINYIDVPVSGKNSTSTWNTGNYGMYTVNNYYRIRVGNTTPYVEPPKPEPIIKESVTLDSTITEPVKEVVPTPKPVLKPKPKPKPKPIIKKEEPEPPTPVLSFEDFVGDSDLGVPVQHKNSTDIYVRDILPKYFIQGSNTL